MRLVVYGQVNPLAVVAAEKAEVQGLKALLSIEYQMGFFVGSVRSVRHIILVGVEVGDKFAVADVGLDFRRRLPHHDGPNGVAVHDGVEELGHAGLIPLEAALNVWDAIGAALDLTHHVVDPLVWVQFSHRCFLFE